MNLLNPPSSDRILEIGCGSGVALALLCERLSTGHITALDRSATAISAAHTRLQAQVASGRVRLLHASLADIELQVRFDNIFAVNVNVFWLKPQKELTVLRTVFAPGGRLYLFYEPPSRAQGARAEAECRHHLTSHGFLVEEVVWADLQPNVGLCLVAAPE